MGLLRRVRDALTAGSTHLRPGDDAPAWDVVDATGAAVSLEAQRGHWVVLYFFPKADTPGCTTQTCSLRDSRPQLAGAGVRVFGAARDFPDSLTAFAQTYAVPFPLLSDPAGVLCRRYGVLGRIGLGRFARRTTFLIDPTGVIRGVLRDIDVQRHGDEVLEALNDLGALSEDR